MSDLGKITETHRRRRAVVYVRQSTLAQVERNVESTARQYALRERAVELGWPPGSVVVVDEDLGRSGASSDGRFGFKELVARGRPRSCRVGVGVGDLAVGALVGGLASAVGLVCVDADADRGRRWRLFAG